MTNKLRRTLLIALIATLLFLTIPMAISVNANSAKTIDTYTYNDVEAIIIGEKVNIEADVTYTDTTTDKLPIQYTVFPIDKMSTLFNSFRVEGFIKGHPECSVVQQIVVIPDNIEYLINLGANYGSADYYDAEEDKVLGTELVASGQGSESEGYYAAVKRRFPDIRNKVASKQYGSNGYETGDWGYVENSLVTYVVADPPKLEERDLFEHIVFPKRGTTNVSVKFNLPQGSYDIYLGFYSYWFSRGAGIHLDGAPLEADYSYTLSASKITYPIANKSLSGGTHEIKVTGQEKFKEAMMSFLCVTSAGSSYQTYSAPTVADTIGLEDETVEVSGLTSGAKLQMFDADTNNLIYEQMVGSGETTATISLNDLPLDGIFRFGFCQANGGGMSDVKISQRTDILVFDVDYNKDYVANSLKINMRAEANSNIVSYRITDEKGKLVAESTIEDPTANWTGDYTLTKNGRYKIELTSAMGGKNVRQIEISNIDIKEPVLTLKFSLDTAKQSTKDKIVYSYEVESDSPIVQTNYVYNQDTKEFGGEDGLLSIDAKKGDYTFIATNALGKVATTKLHICTDKDSLVTAQINQAIVQGFTEISIRSTNGYSLKSAQVYCQTENDTEKMLVKGKSGSFRFNAYDSGVYFIELTAKDGTREIIVLDMTVEAGKQGVLSENTTVILQLVLSFISIVTLITCGYLVYKKIRESRIK